MIVCKGATPSGSKFRRFSRSIHLGGGLRELMNLYAIHGRAKEAVFTGIDREIERCLVMSQEDRAGKARVGHGEAQARLGVLYRVRDLHRFVVTHEAWAPLRHRLLEHLILHPSTSTRWAAARGVLMEEVARGGAFCEAAGGPAPFDPEAFKQAVSDRTGPLGSLLTAVALFNLDAEGEDLPENLLLRMLPGRFPEHTWEVLPGAKRRGSLGAASTGAVQGAPGNAGGWQPTHPLCRYEYLAVDLLHAILRREGALPVHSGPRGMEPAHSPEGSPPAMASHHTVSHNTASNHTAAGIRSGDTAVYCRLEGSEGDPAADQLELLPLEPGTLPAGLLRLAHKRHGPEGAKMLALLLGQFHRHRPGEAATLRLADLAAAAGLHDLSARGARTRLRKLYRIVNLLEGVELTRIAEGDGTSRVMRNKLLTVLGRTQEHRTPLPARGPAMDGEDEPPAEMGLLPDPLVHGSGEGDGLADHFGSLPQTLVDLAGKDHPCLLPLYVLARNALGLANEETGGHGQPQGNSPFERSAASLLREAGIWVSETGRYRALEALRRDLDVLVEQGWLGRWRMERGTGRGAVRDAMEDRIRLYPPKDTMPAEEQGDRRLAAPWPGG